MKLIVIISLLLILTACMSFPKNSQELQTQSTTRHVFIVNKDLDSVESSYDVFLNKCYNSLNKPKIYLNHARVGTDDGFEKSKDATHIKYSVYMGLDPKKYVLDIDLTKEIGSDIVKVDLVAVTSMWKRHFPRYVRIAKGENVSCPW